MLAHISVCNVNYVQLTKRVCSLSIPLSLSLARALSMQSTHPKQQLVYMLYRDSGIVFLFIATVPKPTIRWVIPNLNAPTITHILCMLRCSTSHLMCQCALMINRSPLDAATTTTSPHWHRRRYAAEPIVLGRNIKQNPAQHTRCMLNSWCAVNVVHRSPVCV